MAGSNSLTISDVLVRMDHDGRFCLNDLHRASGGNPSHRPGHWLRSQQAHDLIAEMGDAQICAGPPVVTVNDGINNGTFVVKELVYAYAMWISPKFHLQVIRAYDTLVTDGDPLATLPPEQRALVALMIDQAETKKRLAVTEDKVARIEAKQQAFEEGSKFFTIIGYVVWKGLPSVSASEAAALGKRATRLSKEQCILVDRVRDPRFGVVGSYHESILEAVFAEFLEGL